MSKVYKWSTELAVVDGEHNVGRCLRPRSACQGGRPSGKKHSGEFVEVQPSLCLLKEPVERDRQHQVEGIAPASRSRIDPVETGGDHDPHEKDGYVPPTLTPAGPHDRRQKDEYGPAALPPPITPLQPRRPWYKRRNGIIAIVVVVIIILGAAIGGGVGGTVGKSSDKSSGASNTLAPVGSNSPGTTRNVGSTAGIGTAGFATGAGVSTTSAAVSSLGGG